MRSYAYIPTRRDLLIGGATLGATALAAPPAAAGQPPDPAERLVFREDADLLAHAYGTIHPGLYRYQTMAESDARFAALRAYFSRPRTHAEGYIALARVTAAVRCGHSYPNFYNQSKAIRAALFAGRDRLPFHFRWIGERMIVTRNLSPDAILPPGTEIRAIESVPAQRLLGSLLPLARADGHNDGKRRRILDVGAVDTFQAFDIYWPMLWPALVARGWVTIVADKPDGTRLRAKLALMTATERAAHAPSPIPVAKDAILWTMERKPGGIACLTMPTWSVYNGSWDWRAWLEARLDEIASDGTRGLIVDLRGNEGGLDCGHPILARLADRDIAITGNARRVRYRALPGDLGGYVDTWDDSFRNWGADAIGPRADGFYDLRSGTGDAEGAMRIKATGKRFRGRLAVLVDSTNSSATFGFARIVREHRLGMLIGETTGGNLRGINGGAFLFLRLPQSGIEIDIPLIGYFPPMPQPDSGIVPDRIVPDGIDEIVGHANAAMARALTVLA